ncbi:hypothetical protein CesoFtcFv8_005859 [Champsocephalus esox]|uniref:Uncharacterized protein n=1 Tax=Champsocephalus esox TaxID=159716 RepID=A0AAN8H6A2_9TELE|nr:hypothetical protein CesoFtcFv8_005859 [Champsocephalus esox]
MLSLLGVCPPDATGICSVECEPLHLSSPQGALSSASWRRGTEERTDWRSRGTSGRAEDVAEGEGENNGE